MTYKSIQFEQKKAKTRNSLALRGRKTGFHSSKQGKKGYKRSNDWKKDL